MLNPTGKRLLITFCLDVSPSMGNEIEAKRSAMTMLNDTVRGIVEELARDKKLLNTVELMFITFCTDVEKIDERIAEYQRAGMRYHSPIFVLISDGNPDYEETDETERRAMDLVTERCQASVSGSVCPFIIGIGDELNESTHNTMAGYARGFMDGYFHVMGDEVLQSKIAKMIVKLFTCSVKYVAQRGNFSAKTLDVTSHEMKQVQTQIHREIEKYKLVGGVG